MSEETYVKVGDEYVFTLKDAEGNEITARAKVSSAAETDAKIGNDSLELFPLRSSNHQRIKAFLEAEKAKAIAAPK